MFYNIKNIYSGIMLERIRKKIRDFVRGVTVVIAVIRFLIWCWWNNWKKKKAEKTGR